MPPSFGQLLSDYRKKCGVSQRELARRSRVAASYVNGIEKGLRRAPSLKVLQRFAKVLDIPPEDFYNAAALQKRHLPIDTVPMVQRNPESLGLLRAILRSKLREDQILTLKRQVEQGATKAIILAAGKGLPIAALTKPMPPCLALRWNGKTLLQMQLESLRKCRVQDVLIVKGFEGRQIRYPDVRYAWNRDYEKNNVLESLMSVAEELEGEVVVTYSDIFYEEGVLNQILQSRRDIVIGVDIDWKSTPHSQKNRFGNEPENVIFDSDNKMLQIGKFPVSDKDRYGQFIGIMKLTDRGCQILKNHYRRARLLFDQKPFQRAKTFRNAYLTDLLQDMADLGVPIHCELIGAKQWKEISSIEEFRELNQAFRLFKSLGNGEKEKKQ